MIASRIQLNFSASKKQSLSAGLLSTSALQAVTFPCLKYSLYCVTNGIKLLVTSIIRFQTSSLTGKLVSGVSIYFPVFASNV